MTQNLMICTSTKDALHLNESENATEKYILEGVFAELDTLNRNQRIYPKEEYLKHLQYLRNDIKNGEPLLGELDHPEDRFEVKLKEASHRVLDLWYDAEKNAVMGKIELLNTPNGKLVQSIVDQNIPLHISSRAAGSVNKDNTVSIQQIYTYDLVCKPGFAGAILHRVNESADAPTYTPDVQAFLSEALRTESLNAAPQYGFINENVAISEVKAPANLRKEAQELQINNKQIEIEDMTKPLLEAENPDATVGKPLQVGGGTSGVDPATGTPANSTSEEDTSSVEDNKENNDSSSSDDNSSEDAKDSGIEILDVKAEFEKSEEKDDIDIIDVKPESGKEDTKEESDEDKEDEPSEENKADEAEDTPEVDDKKDEEKIEKEATEANTLNDETQASIKDRKETFDKKIDDLIATIKKKSESKSESKNESVIMAQYPVSMCLNESNFVEFVKLDEQQKNKVVAYLQDNNITDVNSINESWKNGINYSTETPIWLKFAPADYKELYESAPDHIKDGLASTAEYMIFENQRDINIFWENSGLHRIEERKLLNESFANKLPKITAPSNDTALPYGKDFIEFVADMASEYN